MITTELTLNEIYNLSIELNGTQEFKGLIAQKLDLQTKYWLMKLAKLTAKEREEIDALKNELIKELGESKNSEEFYVPQYILVDDVQEINPNYATFSDKYTALLSEVRTIEHFDFKLDQFSGIVADEVYITFMDKLITC